MFLHFFRYPIDFVINDTRTPLPQTMKKLLKEGEGKNKQKCLKIKLGLLKTYGESQFSEISEL